MSGISETTRKAPLAPILSSSTTSAIKTTPIIPNRGRELEITALQIQNFVVNELRLATMNFRFEGILGVHKFDSAYKGWINESDNSPVKTNMGFAVAVKILSTHVLQDLESGLNSTFSSYCLNFMDFVS